MKFRRISLLFLSVAFPAFSCMHAGPYDVQALTAHLKQKLGNIQAEYQRLRNEKSLSYLWDIYTHRPNNLYLNFFGKNNVHSAEDVKSQAETLFLLEDPNVKEQLEEFLRVFTSEAFLRALFGNNIVNKLITCGGKDGAYVFWDKEEYNNPSGKLLFFLRVRHTLHKDHIGENLSALEMLLGFSITALDMQLVFAYDTKSDKIQFIGTKDKIFINSEEVEMDFPIYSPSYTNASVPQSNSIDMD